MVEIGQWVSCEEGLGQVLAVREQYIEEFTPADLEESWGERPFKEFLIIKLFLNHDGKVAKAYRVVYNQSKYCCTLTTKQNNLINKYKTKHAEDYRDYILSDEKTDLDYIVTVPYQVAADEKEQVVDTLNRTCWKVWPNFTFNEFKKEFKKANLKFDFSTKINGYSKPGQPDKIRLMLYSRMMKIVKKKMVFYYAKAVDERELFS